jgi:Rps23 Pro-64 3,4-dihydroxylase Tpa1-like proline 4-hydroxylase
MHLDYSIHPITGKERRVNLIIYMNKDWKEEWGGELNLWEGTPQEMTR